MHIKSQPDTYHDNRNYSHNQLSRPVIVLLLFVAAFGVRLYHIDRPPLDFSSIRQYQTAHIIRGLYYENNNSIAESKKQIAKLNMERMGFVLEPRIIENASLIGYRITGAEHLWIPRTLSSVFWVVGGFFLYLIARTFFSQGISIISTLFYLFLPYSILASRIIQPDPLMVMMMLFSIHRVLKYDEKPSRLNLMAAALVSAVAVLIKPYCIFMIFGAFFSLAVLQREFWKTLFHRDTMIYTFLIILPTIVYYAYGLFTNVGFLGAHARGSFLPHLIIHMPFWMGWLEMIGQAVGYLAFLLAILGLFKIREKKPRALLLGLWTGYLFFGLSATFQIHTHNYYQMPFVPIVALSLAPVAAAMAENARTARRTSIFIFIFVLIAIVAGAGLSMRRARAGSISSNHKSTLKTASAIIGINPEFRKFLGDDFTKEVRTAKEIGELVGHSSKTLFLTPDFGRVLAYHGELAGLPWPISSSLYARSVRGERAPDIEKDFAPDHVVLLYQGRFIKYTPDYFIVTALDEFEKQRDLKMYLYSNFPILAKSNDYLIFDLRKMSE